MRNRLVKIKILIVKVRMFGKLYFSSAIDFLFYWMRIPVKEVGFSLTDKTIIYLGGNLPARIARIIKWHKRFEEFTSILVCHKDGYRDKYVNPALDHVLLFRNHWHLKRILEKLKKATLIHAFGPKSFYPSVAMKSVSIPVVYDMQDVLVTYYGLNPSIRWYKEELLLEKYCLENCRGFISHSLEFQEAIRRYQIKSKPANIFFPLCCDDDVQENKKGIFNPDEFHVVYVGEVAGSFRDSKQFATIQFHSIIEEFSKQNIHLHLYAAPGTMQDDIDEYRQMAKENRFVHMHESVHQSALAKELSQYDFGLIPFFFKDTIHDWAKFKYSTSLKLFNYVEAGIPVISTKDIVFQSWIVERYGFGIAIEKKDIENLKSIISYHSYENFLSNIKINRPKISLANHIKRLINFYDKVIAKENVNKIDV